MEKTRKFGITLANLKLMARNLNCTLRRRDGEYRVNFKDSSEACAYYTDDAFDALQTMEAMKRGDDNSAAFVRNLNQTQGSV